MTRFRNLALACVLAISATALAQFPHFIDTNPGIVESSSIAVAALPTRALFFIDTYYPDIDVRSMVEEYVPKIYQVTMDDGTFMEFDADGYLVKIDSPNDNTLPTALLKGELSKGAYEELTELGIENYVTSLVMTATGPQVIFENMTPEDLHLAHY